MLWYHAHGMHGIELCSNLSDFILGPCCAFLSGISSIHGLKQASNKTRTRYIVEFIERLSSNLNQLYGQTIFISLGSVDHDLEDLSFFSISLPHEKESQNQASSAVVNWSFELILKWNIIKVHHHHLVEHHHHGYPAYSHHGKIPPWWGNVSND